MQTRQAMRMIGSPDTVRQRLSNVMAVTWPDELMLSTPVYDIDERFRSLDLIMKHVMRPST